MRHGVGLNAVVRVYGNSSSVLDADKALSIVVLRPHHRYGSQLLARVNEFPHDSRVWRDICAYDNQADVEIKFAFSVMDEVL